MGLLNEYKRASLPRPVSGCPVRYITEQAQDIQSAERNTACQLLLTGRVRNRHSHEGGNPENQGVVINRFPLSRE